MGRTPKGERRMASTLNFRLDPATIAELEEVAFGMSAPGAIVSKADVVRQFIAEGLAARRKAKKRSTGA